MFRRKRCSAMKKMPCSVSLIRPLPLERILHRLHHHQAVNCRFTRQKPRFALVLVVGKRAPHRQSSAYSRQRQRSIRRNRAIVLLRLDVRRQVPAHLPVRHNESRRQARKWHQPFRIRKTQSQWTAPDRFLISCKISRQPGKTRGRPFFRFLRQRFCVVLSGTVPRNCAAHRRRALPMLLLLRPACGQQLPCRCPAHDAPSAKQNRCSLARQHSAHFTRYAAVNATDAAICAICTVTGQFRPPMFGAFSGTTIVSPGFSTVFSGSPLHQPELFFAASTEPSARTTNAACRFESWVNPPAWLKYHLALRPAR